MAATESDLIFAISEHRAAYDAAFSVLNGQLTKVNSVAVAREAQASQVRNWKDLILAGGVVVTPPAPSPSPAPSATIALLKAAMAVAPVTHSAIPTTNVGTIVQGTIGDKLNPVRIPGANGTFVRHWMQNGTSGGGNNGGKVAELEQVAKVAELSSLGPTIGGAAELISPTGDSRIKAYGAGGAWDTTSGSIADFAIGFTLTGRAFGAPSRFAFGTAHVYVSENGGPLTLMAQKMTWPEDSSYSYVDFGTVATRNIVWIGRGGIESGEIVVAPSATMTPYDWTTGKFLYGFMGDSWGQTGENVRGFTLPQASAKLLGASHIVGSTIGGTGFIANTSGTQPPGTNVTRLSAWTSGVPLLLDCSLIVNDNITDPAALRAAVDTVLSAGRAASPNALILVTLWNSQGSRSTNTSGNEYIKMTIIRERARLMSGKWIILNAFDGIWETSDGTTKATPSGPMITGEGSVASPTGTGNADTWIDNNGGRHPTSAGVIGIANYKAAMVKEALASMSSSGTAPAPAPAPSPSPGTTLATETFETSLGSFTAVGPAARTTTNPINGAASLALGAAGYLTRPGFDFGTGDWTVELSLRHPGSPAVYTCLFAQRNAGNTSNSNYDAQLFFGGSSNIWFSQPNRADTGGPIPQPGYANNVKHRVAVVCINQVVSVYFDRVRIGTPMTNANALPGTGRTFTLGGDPSVISPIFFENGLIDDFRVSAYGRFTGDSYTEADE